jgi:pimeloyl-ACP methyl ester carboxylesterase
MRQLITPLLVLLSLPLVADTPMPKPDIRTLDTGGPALRYVTHEPPTAATNRPLVVLIHGWSCDSSYWEAQVPALRDRYRVVTLDLAGHGDSGADRNDWSMRAFGEDVRRVVDAVDPRAPLVLVGHSMGGPVAIEAARQLGQRVRAVIGVDTFSTVGLPRPPAAETAARVAFFERDFAGATRMFVTRTFFRPDADPALRERIASDMASGDPRVGIAAVQGLNDWDGVPAMAQLPVPIIAINADLAPTDAERIRRSVPRFELVVMPQSGHFLMMEDPTRFNPLLLEQLERFVTDR